MQKHTLILTEEQVMHVLAALSDRSQTMNMEQCIDCGHIAPDVEFGLDEAICPSCWSECSARPISEFRRVIVLDENDWYGKKAPSCIIERNSQ